MIARAALLSTLAVAALGGAALVLLQGEDTAPPTAPLGGARRVPREPADGAPLDPPRGELIAAPRDDPADTRAPGEPDQPAGPALAGRVLDPSGRPVAAAEVLVGPFERTADRLRDVRAAAAAVTRSDSEGGFVLPRPAGDVLRVAVRAAGFAPRDLVLRPLELVRPEDHDGVLALGDVTLEPGGVLVGVVRDTSGEPVRGVELMRLDARNRAAHAQHAGVGELLTVSGEDGRYELRELTPGPWRVLVRSVAHPDLVLEGDAAGTADRPEVRDVVLGDGVPLAGRLAAPPPKRAQLEARALPVDSSAETLLAGPRHAAVDEAGAFTLQGLVPGVRYRVAVWRRGDDPSAGPRSTEVVAAGGGSGLVLRLVEVAEVVARAVDARTGAAVEDLEAHLVEALGAAAPSAPVAGPDGRPALRFTDGEVIAPVPRAAPGRGFHLVVWGRETGPAVASGLTPTQGQRLDVGRLALPPGRALEVTVRDASGAPAAGVEVALEPVALDALGTSTPLAPEAAAVAAALRARAAPAWRTAFTCADGVARLLGVPEAPLDAAVVIVARAPGAAGEARVPLAGLTGATAAVTLSAR